MAKVVHISCQNSTLGKNVGLQNTIDRYPPLTTESSQRVKSELRFSHASGGEQINSRVVRKAPTRGQKALPLGFLIVWKDPV